MFAIETFVGVKYGGWLRGTLRFMSREGAERQADEMRKGEFIAGATKMQRRVVSA